MRKKEDAARKRAWRKAHPESARAAARRYYAKNRERIREVSRVYRKNHPEIVKKQYQRYCAAHPEKRRLSRRRKTLAQYGLSIGDFDCLVAVQKGRCAVCGRKPVRHGHIPPLVVDHDHQKMHVRKLLCQQCNTGLGMFRDNPKILGAAARYRRQTQNEWEARQLTLPLALVTNE